MGAYPKNCATLFLILGVILQTACGLFFSLDSNNIAQTHFTFMQHHFFEGKGRSSAAQLSRKRGLYTHSNRYAKHMVLGPE
jgi:hypothetical protein